MKPQKFVIVGDPHCGKSVFISGLQSLLPLADRFIFRACPDGEGTWLAANYDDPAVVALRRKGSFTPEIVDWYASSLAGNQMAPIIVVDVGGRRSAENEKILTQGGVQNAIILGRDDEGIAEWREWLEKLGLSVIAELVSDYDGTEDVVSEDEVIKGSVHHLERGEDVSVRPAIKAVAEKIMSMKPTREKVGPSEAQYPSFVHLKSVVLQTADMARALGKDVGETKIWWEGSDLPKIAESLTGIRPVPQILEIDGYVTAWLVAAISYQLKDSVVRQNSPDGFVRMEMRSPYGKGTCGQTSLQNWETRELGETNGVKTVMVEFKLNPSIPLRPKDLARIRPPRVDKGTVVIISGRGPHWLTASIAQSYIGMASAVGCFQPGRGATVAWTESEDIPLGSVFDVQPLI